MERNKLVYIASPYSGDVERNVAFAKAALCHEPGGYANCLPSAISADAG